MKTKKIIARNTCYGDRIIVNGKIYHQFDKSLEDNEVWFALDKGYTNTIMYPIKKQVNLIIDDRDNNI